VHRVQGFEMLKKKSFYYFLPNPNGEEEGPSTRNSTQKKNGRKMQNLQKPHEVN
jgi:hypothetical protein